MAQVFLSYVGLGIFLMNLDAARGVYTTARRERSLASAEP